MKFCEKLLLIWKTSELERSKTEIMNNMIYKMGEERFVEEEL